ncbi:putative surface protein with fasciclin (FAS1) repeats [Nocardioides thalensis]|uniref:Putative surface protein with fasciclin (FAS1) repeats n=1 Tax=Nocardioides thalensis TaxID=1914755 RepID=A0A853C7U3_9ACTN|nr:fasciclin domain-containing protein [Nocardioides thalensis]NYJ03221.1 putative surface protein with fasciclin (FAS1) repeats [Nocardioides thalensis]
MKLLRTVAAATTVFALSGALAACSEEDEPTNASDDSAQTSDSAEPEGAGDSGDSGDTGDMGAGAATFGDGCAEIPTSGAGSFDGMVNDPVATAASNNPLLKTLVAAVTSIDGLADTLNGQEALTVFAPYDPAFAEIPEKDLNALVEGGMKDGQDSTLYKILAHHVLPTNADPAAVGGDQDTLAGDTLTVEGDAESGMTVSDGTVTASVLCGNIPTANATVYVIDKVLTGVK